MKRLYFFILIITFIMFFQGCQSQKESHANNPSDNSNTKQQTFKLDDNEIKKEYSESDFKKILEKHTLKQSNTSAESSKEMSSEDKEKYSKVYDITPLEVKKEIDIQIFKDNATCESYLIHSGEVFNIGLGFGGFGVMDIKTCDFDNNGQKDLIYTFSWGSGLHRSQIALFNLSSSKETTLDYNKQSEDIQLEKLSDNSFNIYSSEIVPNEVSDYSHLTLNKKDLLGKIEYSNGKITIQ